MQLDFALSPARVHGAAYRMQVCQGQYPSAVIAQPNSGVVQVGVWHINVHIGARAVLGSGMTYGATGLVFTHGAMVHTSHHPGHASVVHTYHGAMIHSRHGRLARTAVIHACHPSHAAAHSTHHVGHIQPLRLIDLGNCSG